MFDKIPEKIRSIVGIQEMNHRLDHAISEMRKLTARLDSKEITRVDIDLLEKKGIFVVGNARSGTTILCECLNLSKDIYMLYEGHFYLNHSVDNFAGVFNDQHFNFKNSRRKGTFVSLSGNSKETGIEFLSRIGKYYRFAGDKIAFGPHGKINNRPYQEIFFEFHATFFYHSTYFLIIRNPLEVVWSSYKMFPEIELKYHFESWLLTTSILIDVYQTFPNAFLLFLEDFGTESVNKINQILDLKISIPDGMFKTEYMDSMLKNEELPDKLAGYKEICEDCQVIYQLVKESFSKDTFTYIGLENQVRFVEKTFKPKVAKVLNKVIPGSTLR